MRNASDNEKYIANKKRIREEYKRAAQNSHKVRAIEDLFNSDIDRRVAVYARVAIDDPRQTSSYELQKTYYEALVQKNLHWSLAGMYIDEGIYNHSTKSSENFIKMIQDCKEGKIDLIITKSVSRLPCGPRELMNLAERLALREPPVGILFLTEIIYTLDSECMNKLKFIMDITYSNTQNI